MGCFHIQLLGFLFVLEFPFFLQVVLGFLLLFLTAFIFLSTGTHDLYSFRVCKGIGNTAKIAQNAKFDNSQNDLLRSNTPHHFRFCFFFLAGEVIGCGSASRFGLIHNDHSSARTATGKSNSLPMAPGGGAAISKGFI